MARNDVRQAASARQAEAEQALARYAEDPGGAALAIRDDQDYWTQRQEAALAAVGVKGATVGELQMFLHVCNRTRLDPFLRQIYMIPRREWDPFTERYVVKQTIQVGIDGFRIQRDRAAEAGGFMIDFEETIWYNERGEEHLTWLWPEPPTACKVVVVKVYADGMRLRSPGVLRYAAYVPRKNGTINPTGRWLVDPDHQLEKCAEAFASRRACPADLGGLYIPEEMGEGALGEEAERKRRRNGRTAPVRATVIPGGSAPAEDPGDPQGPDPDLEERREAAARRIHALFSGAGYGGEEDHDLRVAVLSVLAREEGTEALVQVGSTAELNAWQAERAAAALQQFISQAAADKDRNPHDALAQLADAVRKSRESDDIEAGLRPDDGEGK